MKGGISMDKQFQRLTILLYVGHSGYPLTRCIQLAKFLASHHILFLVNQKHTSVVESLQNQGIEPFSFSKPSELDSILSETQPDVLITDGLDTDFDESNMFKKAIPTTIHFDDFGEGGKEASRVIQTLYREERETLPSNYVAGHSGFIIPEELEPYAQIGLRPSQALPLPHIVVAFTENDEDNLSYRTLRHLLHLQIPLAITVLLHSNYRHKRDELKMMALGRKQTRIIETDDFLQSMSESDMVICDARYTPFYVAVMGKPCIVIAQNEKEGLHGFPREHNGFVYLGLGRKLKQSHLQQAVMEFILHHNRSTKAIKKQLSLKLVNNNQNMLRFIEKIIQEGSSEVTRRS
jgi:spore coat polysaccharide biosynthesis predicted glycosyltransferase SpsG